MQQFFFLCTMLIIASDGFPEEITGSGIPKKIKKKASEFEPKPIYPNTGRFMSGDVSLPTFFVPYLYKAPFLVPVRTKHGKGDALRRIDRAKRFRKKFSRKRKLAAMYPPDRTGSATFNPTEYSEYLENPNVHSGTHRDFSNFNSLNAVISGNPNQYTIRSCPRIKERAFRRFKRRRLSPLERRYWNDTRFKNKRSANNLSREETSSEERKKLAEGSESGDTKASPESPLIPKVNSQGEGEADLSAQEKKEIAEFKNLKKNLIAQKTASNCSREVESKPPEENFPLNDTRSCASNSTGVSKGDCESRSRKSSLTSEESSYAESLKKDRTADESMREATQEYASRIVKLKEMLEQVQSLLKEDIGRNKEKMKQLNKEKGSKLTDRFEEVKSERQPGPGPFTLKDKIDTAIPILVQISEDLVRISNQTEGGAKLSSRTEKAPPRCSPDGTWTSKEYGLEMTFKTLPNMMLKVTPTSKYEGVINKKWSIQGLTLSKQEGPLILAAICPQKRKIASFMGQCKICKDQDIIFGTWTIYTFVHKFTDLWRAVDYRLDVLKKKKTTIRVKRDKRKTEKTPDCLDC